MSRLLRLGVASAIAAAAFVPVSADAWTCTPRGIQHETYSAAGHTVDAYGIYWVC